MLDKKKYLSPSMFISVINYYDVIAMSPVADGDDFIIGDDKIFDEWN